jgi:hypothetical protein
MMLRITAPHFCAGIGEGMCAPIIKYMRGWTVRQIREYCQRKGWKVEVLK